MTSETDDGNFIYLSVGDALEIYAASSNSLPGRPPITYEARTRSKGRSARPASYAHYQQADSALQAAVLAHGIAETQPFVDGNKRTALVAMLTFLELNGYTLSRRRSRTRSLDHQLQLRCRP